MDPPGRPRRGVRPGVEPELLAEVVGKLDVAVDLSGGIRDEESLAAALATGCARVNIGTAALENPSGAPGDQRARRQGGVGLDVKIDPRYDGGLRLRGRGWETDGGICGPSWNALTGKGVRGSSSPTSPKTARCRDRTSTCCPSVAERTGAPVIASGGVSSLDDLRAIATLTDSGIEGAIIGKALYAGRFTLPQALAAVGG